MKINNSTTKPGDVYALPEKKHYTVVKVLAIDKYGVHVRFFEKVFKLRPRIKQTTKIEYFIGHTPLDKESWQSIKKELLFRERVKKSELEGYEYWKHDQGGYFNQDLK